MMWVNAADSNVGLDGDGVRDVDDDDQGDVVLGYP
jgi:hypothetical protein